MRYKNTDALPVREQGENPMRDRLIELIDAFREMDAPSDGRTWTEHFADHLLESGVIVPPCKVGDIVFGLRECSCEDIDGVYTQCEFYGYGLEDRICTIPKGKKCPHQYRIDKYSVTESNILMFTRLWGKTVFLTREEAEKALAERSEG